MDTKKIGNIGESKAIAKFVEYGIPVYIPFGDNERCDLLAEFGGKINKVQIKSSTTFNGNCTTFCILSSSYHRNRQKRKYTEEEVDYFVLYDVVTDKMFLLDFSETGGHGEVRIRYTKTKNGNIKNIKYYNEYLIDDILKNTFGISAIKNNI